MTMRHTNEALIWEYIDWIDIKTAHPIKAIISVATIDSGLFVINVGFQNGESYPIYVTRQDWHKFLRTKE